MLRRLNRSERDRAFGPPCSPLLHSWVTLWGQRVRVHRLVREHLVKTAQLADELLVAKDLHAYRPRRIDSYVCRNIRHSGNPSMHAYALAFDVFLTEPHVPPPGGVWTPDAKLHSDFIRVWELAGWTWGGRWGRRDEPHFEWAAAPPV